jgi:hypothetical protein
MFKGPDLTEVRRVEEAFLSIAHKSSDFDLTNLVAIFTRRDTESWLPVFNIEYTPASFDFPSALTLKQLLHNTKNLVAGYDGIVIAFDALKLVRRDITTRGSRYYPIELLFGRLHQTAALIQTQWNLANTLFATLLEQGELKETPPEFSVAAWLQKTTQLFRLTLPTLVEKHRVEGLVAVVPSENFKNYLDEGQYSLVYVDTYNISPEDVAYLSLEQFQRCDVETTSRLCAAFSEVELFHKHISARNPGFVDLRKELRRGPCSGNIERINIRAADIRTTIKQLGQLYYRYSLKESRFLQPALALAAEYELANQELDDIAGVVFTVDWDTYNTSTIHSYYLTLPEGTPYHIESLETLLNRREQTRTEHAESIVVSFRSLRSLFYIEEGLWLALSDILIKLDRPQVFARSTYLISRLLGKNPNLYIDSTKIVDYAAIACLTYSVAEPFTYYWHRGDHEHHLLQSYKNFHEQLDQLIAAEDQEKRKSYYQALKLWWNIEEHDYKESERLAEAAIKELEFAIPTEESEDAQYYMTIHRLYELFSSILNMFSRTWQPSEVRERLLRADYDQIVKGSVVIPWDILDPTLDPKQPTPLFFAKLQEFLDLSEESYKIRIEEHDPDLKAMRLVEIGIKLGEQIGLNFPKYVSMHAEQQKMSLREEDESDYRVGAHHISMSSLAEELDNSLLLPEHERLWMKSLYLSTIDDHADIIYNLLSKPVRGRVVPTQVTQHVSTEIEISLINKYGELNKRGVDVEIILSSSNDYDIQSRSVRKKFDASRPVKYTVAFRTTGDVALLFQYIIDKKKQYYDEAWVYVIGLGSQARRVRNPYQYGSEIVDPIDYYGRRQELDKIFDKLWTMAGGRERQNFRIRGMRRSGKTSLLHMIRKAIQEPKTRNYYHISAEMGAALDKWHPVFYSLQKLPDDIEMKDHLDTKVFFRSLTKQICKSLGWSNEAIHNILLCIDADFEESGDIIGAVEAQLERVLDELQEDEHILILLDEVDLIGTEKDDRFFGQLRSIINSSELTPIAWILTSTRALQAPGEGLESPLHNIFAPIILKKLDAAEASRLILEPARKENIYFSPEATERILQQTGGQPFLLQAVCSNVVDQLNLEQTSYVSRTLADSVIEKLLQPGTVIDEQCQFLWDRTTSSGRTILVLLSQHEPGIYKNELIDAFNAISFLGKHDASAQFDGAWKDLLANDLTSKDQEEFCHLSIPILSRWLNERISDSIDSE